MTLFPIEYPDECPYWNKEGYCSKEQIECDGCSFPDNCPLEIYQEDDDGNPIDYDEALASFMDGAK